MKIFKDSIFTHIELGRCTLQVPDCIIATSEEKLAEAEQYDEVPDEWMVYLKNNRPAVGREQGFLYLTRAGYEANKDEMKKRFATKQQRGHTWDDFVRRAEEHFDEVERATKKYRKHLEDKLAEFNAIAGI